MRNHYRRITRCPFCKRKPKLRMHTLDPRPGDVYGYACWRVECSCGFTQWMSDTLMPLPDKVYWRILDSRGAVLRMARAEWMRDKAVRQWNVWCSEGVAVSQFTQHVLY